MTGSDESFLELRNKRVWVAGHKGMVGAALLRRLEREDCELVLATREELDLLDRETTERWVLEHKPDTVFVSAAKVGGILANDSFPASFLYENLTIQNNVINACHLAEVEKLLFLGSSCIYPKLAPQPITEDALLSGPLEPTNQWYAVAKIAGIKMCQAYRRQYGLNFISAMPTNLYGPKDNYDLETSHVLPALMAKLHRAKIEKRDSITIWGTGAPLREFLHVDDLADALVFLMKQYSREEHVNVGSGEEVSIRELAHLMADVIGYTGKQVFDHEKPDGTPRKLMDSSRLRKLGWVPNIRLRDGVVSTYRQYREELP